MMPAPSDRTQEEQLRPRRRRLYLVRHGHVSYFDDQGQPVDPRHVSLSSQGENQVRSLAAAMQGVQVDRIICSDLARARQTAQILADGMGSDCTPQLQPALREIRAGRLRDIPREQREAELAYAYDRAAVDGARFIGGEEFAELEQRILGTLDALMQDPDWNSALLVSHDAVNRVLLCWAAGIERSAMAAFEQDMACLNIIDVDTVGGKAVRRLIRTLNYTPYDGVKAAVGLTVMEQVFHAYRSDPA